MLCQSQDKGQVQDWEKRTETQFFCALNRVTFHAMFTEIE